MKNHTQRGGINQPPLYVCASGCDMSFSADELRVHNNECWHPDCWDCCDMERETCIDYCDLPEFVPDSGWQPIEAAPDVSALVEALEEAKLTLELLQGKGSSAKPTLSIIERAIAAYRRQKGGQL